MTANNSLQRMAWWVLGCALVAWPGVPVSAQAGEVKLEAVLVWATNGPKPDDQALKDVTQDIEKKLRCIPFKYTNYFEVNRRQFAFKNGTAKVSMSRDCKLTLKTKEDGQTEVTLIGRGKPVGTITQVIKKEKCLVVGGPAEDSTAWFVVIKQIE